MYLNQTIAENFKYSIERKMIIGSEVHFLENVATQKNKIDEKETAYIFSDGSAIIIDPLNKTRVDNAYGLSPNNIKL